MFNEAVVKCGIDDIVAARSIRYDEVVKMVDTALCQSVLVVRLDGKRSCHIVIVQDYPY